MKNIPVQLSGYTLMITDAPTIKTRDGKDGQPEPVTNYAGEIQFTVELRAKPRPQEGRRAGKAELLTVTLTADPGDGFEPGMIIELINPVVNHYAMVDKEDNRKISNAGLSFKADGLTPAVGMGLSSAA